jgi:hypothetical protein
MFPLTKRNNRYRNHNTVYCSSLKSSNLALRTSTKIVTFLCLTFLNILIYSCWPMFYHSEYIHIFLLTDVLSFTAMGLHGIDLCIK